MSETKKYSTPEMVQVLAKHLKELAEKEKTKKQGNKDEASEKQ